MIAKEGLRGVGPRGLRKCCASTPGLPAVRAHRDRLTFLHDGTTHKRPSSLQVQCCHWRAIRRRNWTDQRRPRIRSGTVEELPTRSLCSLTGLQELRAQEEVTE